VKRTILLTASIVALPLLLLLPGAARLLGSGSPYRLAVLWGLPAAAGLVAALLDPRAGVPRESGRPGAPIARLLLVCAVALCVEPIFIYVGHATGWLTFTYGDQPLYEHPLRALAWALPLCVLLATLGWERALRGALYGAWAERLPKPGAMAIACLAGLALSIPSILPGLSVPDGSFAAAALVSAACREISCGLVVLSGGSILVSGLYRGVLCYVEAFLINDWYSVYFPMANYSSSDRILYLVRGACAVAAAAIVAAGAWAVSRRPRAPSSGGGSDAPARERA